MNFSEYTKSEWTDAFNEDFAFLKQIPSSKVLSMVSLVSKDKELFTVDLLEKLASDRGSIPKETRENIFHMRNREQMKFHSVKDIKSLINHRLSICTDNEEKEILENAQAVYENITTPKAKETRKIFFPKIQKAFQVKPRNGGGGCWSIPIIIADKQMELVLDFGGRFSTMNYWIDVFPDLKPDKIVFISYEETMGLYEPDWDLMRSDLLEQHADVFIKVVQRAIKAIESGFR